MYILLFDTSASERNAPIQLHALVYVVAMCGAAHTALHYSFENASYCDGENNIRTSRVFDYWLMLIIWKFSRHIVNIIYRFVINWTEF